MIHETEQERNLRLQTLQRNDAQRLINENEEQRNLRHDMTDYKSLVTTLLVEQKLKGMRNDKTDSNCFNKMLLCTERTRGHNIYKIKIRAAFTRTTMNTALRLPVETKPLPFCVQDSI